MPTGRTDILRDRIDAAGDISGADRLVLKRFDDRLTLHSQDYSNGRHDILLRRATIIAEETDDDTLTRALVDRDAAEDLVNWINRTYDNEETNQDYRSLLRILGAHLTDGDDPPESLDWVPTGTSESYDPSPDPRDMLRWDEEVQAMLDACLNPRDKALIAFQFDAGCRGGELKSLTVGDVQDHKHGLHVTVEGKQGRRTVLLVPSVPYVQQWLIAHPAGDDPDAPLWSKLSEPERLSDRMFGLVFDRVADRAGVEKPVTPTNFRKSSAAFLASRNLNQAHIEDHHGWVRGSSVAARYISIFAEDSDRELARLHGVDVSEEEPEDMSSLTCPRCDKETPRNEPLCVWCGQALDQQAATDLDTADDEIHQTLAELSPEMAKRVLDLVDVLDNPEVRAALLDRD